MRYPSTDEQQSVHLDFGYPDTTQGLNRWLPLVKWFLAIPHYVLLFFLYIGGLFVVIGGGSRAATRAGSSTTSRA